MHYRLEIVMPKTDNVEARVKEVLAPFKESTGVDHSDHEDEYLYPHEELYAFYDYYQIGGRWAGQKNVEKLDQSKLDEFYKWLKDEGVTVSGVTAGKQEIKPSSQIPKVDAQWNKLFGYSPCPIFKHSNSPHGSYKEYEMDGDIQPLRDCIETTNCSRVIIAGPDHGGESFVANHMVTTSVYNGVTFQDTDWKGDLKSAVSAYQKKIEKHSSDWRDRCMPTGEWLVVTVDYHT